MWSAGTVVRAGPGTCSLSCLCRAGPCRKGFRNQGGINIHCSQCRLDETSIQDLCPLSCDEKRSHIWPLGHSAIGESSAGTYILCRFLKVSMPILNWLYTSRMHLCLFQILLKLQAACASLPVMERNLFFLLTQSVPDKSGTLVALSSTEGHRMFQEAGCNSLMRVWDQRWSLVLFIHVSYVANHPTEKSYGCTWPFGWFCITINNWCSIFYFFCSYFTRSANMSNSYNSFYFINT